MSPFFIDEPPRLLLSRIGCPRGVCDPRDLPGHRWWLWGEDAARAPSGPPHPDRRPSTEPPPFAFLSATDRRLHIGFGERNGLGLVLEVRRPASDGIEREWFGLAHRLLRPRTRRGAVSDPGFGEALPPPDHRQARLCGQDVLVSLGVARARIDVDAPRFEPSHRAATHARRRLDVFTGSWSTLRSPEWSFGELLDGGGTVSLIASESGRASRPPVCSHARVHCAAVNTPAPFGATLVLVDGNYLHVASQRGGVSLVIVPRERRERLHVGAFVQAMGRAHVP
ncbi:MAG: hypothetical protein AAGH15_13415 [Myxococcota bacterium]